MTARAQLILANRAFLDHEAPRWADSPSAAASGGLLAAVRPVIAPWDGRTGTTWIGAGMGRFDREWVDERGYEILETPRGPLRHRRLFFGSSTWQGHYGEVANSFTWPLFHLVRVDLPKATPYYPEPHPPSEAGWQSFVAVNRAFAAAACEEDGEQSCWVHDYQLALVPAMLRERGYRGPIGFFLHIPFPSMAVIRPYLEGEARERLRAIVAGMLGADLAGFQTPGDVERFIEAAGELCGARPAPGGVEAGGRLVRLGAYPVGIDPEEVLTAARRARPVTRVRLARELGLPVVVGLERGDFTKGIPERLRAIAEAYRRGHRFAYIGIASPTREGVEVYGALEAAIEREAARAREAAYWVGCPFTQVRASVGWDDVVALQRDADVVFTSSLADGMNLVPLQAAIAQSLRPAEERAVVLAGVDAGVAKVYGGDGREGLRAVDPLDQGSLLEGLVEGLEGRPARVSDAFIAKVREHDAKSWGERFLADLEGKC
ncbi:trehalose-6-phosphate synthase [Tepidiforma bonchosmolovskayae]|jgi:trehalose-6-phosphate synthase|uniref:Trehalose-6-phosphate synthase n=1 Tax=Tepidiforma bonchosmolovskayae TaxID=2601677 RepID=A0ABX6C4D4_9CHLR|nr:trehalose-6-phosphate synthase [Tepidiforma bonchosmolovskayae]QFG03306.1 trehalose-6-phosphate synthase [Tepidiforma bonchosmolovskayae]